MATANFLDANLDSDDDSVDFNPQQADMSDDEAQNDDRGSSVDRTNGGQQSESEQDQSPPKKSKHRSRTPEEEDEGAGNDDEDEDEEDEEDEEEEITVSRTGALDMST